jgi:hypothetical protein
VIKLETQAWGYGLAFLLLTWLLPTALRLEAGHPMQADPRFDGWRFRLEQSEDQASKDGGVRLLELLSKKTMTLQIAVLPNLSFAQLANASGLGGRWSKSTVADLEKNKEAIVVQLKYPAVRYVLVQAVGKEYVKVLDPFLGSLLYPRDRFLQAWLEAGFGQLYTFGETQKSRGFR